MPWRVPIGIIYALPILIAAREFDLRVGVAIILLALAFSVLDLGLGTVDLETGILTMVALLVIG